jgi:hypothetical protein
MFFGLVGVYSTLFMSEEIFKAASCSFFRIHAKEDPSRLSMYCLQALRPLNLIPQVIHEEPPLILDPSPASLKIRTPRWRE